jgi:nucleoid DNA-binding protein
LRPRKAKEFIPEVAKDTALSEEAVSAIVSYYWQEVRKSLSSLKHPRIHVSNLGDFVTKHWKLDDKIDMLEKFEENNNKKDCRK